MKLPGDAEAGHDGAQVHLVPWRAKVRIARGGDPGERGAAPAPPVAANRVAGLGRAERGHRDRYQPPLYLCSVSLFRGNAIGYRHVAALF